MRRQGFTLIELLVVVAIIALLAAILFPIFANVKERGRQVQCLSNMKEVSTGFLMYEDDNCGGMPSLSRFVDAVLLRRTSNPPMDWCGSDEAAVGCLVHPERGSIFPYVKSKQVYVCPSDFGVAAEAVKGAPRNYGMSYDINYMLHFAKMDSVSKRPSRILLMMQESRSSINDGYFAWDYSTGSIDWPSKIHYKGTTVSYCDAHASWRSFKQLDKERLAGYWDTRQ